MLDGDELTNLARAFSNITLCIISQECNSNELFSLMMEIADTLRVRLNIVAEVDQSETGTELVAAGLGIGVRSSHSVAESVRSGRLSVIPVTGFPRRIPYGFVFRSGVPLSEEAKALVEYLTSCLAIGGLYALAAQLLPVGR